MKNSKFQTNVHIASFPRALSHRVGALRVSSNPQCSLLALFGIWCLVLGICAAPSVQAAEFYFGVHNPSVGVGSVFEVGVFVKTDGESINAVEGKILFPQEQVALNEIREGSSFVNLWIQKPEVSGLGEVFFSGFVPGGFTGEDGYLFSLFFEAIQEGQVRVQIGSENILLSDGKGSKAVVTQAPLIFDITGEAQAVNELEKVEDVTPPESFSPQVARDSSIFDGKWFLAFAAQDKGSGIDHYEVQEGGEWKVAESPYVLADQKLREGVSVKAVDNEGNERIENAELPNQSRWYENPLTWIIIIGIAILVVIVGRILWRKKMQREK